MHGLGNDFIIFDNQNNPKINDANFLRKISDRRFGIGCDQVMIIEDTSNPENFKIKMYNSDGTETGACGNGSRCVASFLMNKNSLNSLTLETMSGHLKHMQTLYLQTQEIGNVFLILGRQLLNLNSLAPLSFLKKQQHEDFPLIDRRH